MATGVVTTQPMTKKNELLGFIRDLDPTQVSGLFAPSYKVTDQGHMLHEHALFCSIIFRMV